MGAGGRRDGSVVRGVPAFAQDLDLGTNIHIQWLTNTCNSSTKRSEAL